jgi:hypothetical protein
MAKTRLSLITALAIAALSLLLILARWSLAGSDPFATSGGTPWRVTLVAVGETESADTGGTSLQPVRGANVWQWISLHALPPAEQRLVTFLLLLPVGGLIVGVYRTVIGVPTFGTFTPALLGVAFLDWNALPFGLGIVFVTVLVGWGLRRALDHYHLLIVPRLGILLTLIVSFLLLVVVATSWFGMPASQYIALFPLVILTHMVERFGTLECDEGTPASFKALLGTFLVAVTISLALGPEVVAATLLSYPELLGLVVAAHFVLGRYTGYRLTELFRFQGLAQDGPPPGGDA